ncbi:MAG: hypothetical protein RJA70_4390 [Pseudomonadota bacterium]|jgi:serine/threonine protein kinase
MSNEHEHAEVAEYHVLGELGRGGQAVIKLAVPAGDTENLVVLKAPHEELINESRVARMLATEANLMSRMVHQNICSVTGLRRFKSELVIEMEYLRGQSLRRVLHRSESQGEFPIDLHLRVIYQVLEALDYAHRLEGDDGWCMNVVHRDVSPHNVILTYDGKVKLLDFGIAKLSAVDLSTTVGTLKGKLVYMAPEQLEPDKADHRSDLFAVGVMLWEALTGRRMWQDLDQKVVAHHLATGTLPDVVSNNPLIPGPLKALCASALAPIPQLRPNSAREFSNALRDYLTRSDRVVGNPSVGKRVAQLFAKERRQMERLVGAELKKLHQARSGRRPSRTYADTVPPSQATHAPQVLVIDDSELSRGLMIELLEESGIRTVGLPTAINALRVVIERRISLIISDVNMPELPGNELVRQIRSHPATRHVPIFLTSALSLDELGNVDANGLIEKDRLEDELVPLVRRTLAMQENP